jgi:hypothetical protein
LLDPFGLVHASTRVVGSLVRAVLPAADEPGEAPADRSVQARLTELLGRGVRHSTESSRDELFHHVLDQLVPDEARILAALAPGRPAALVHVYASTGVGTRGEALLQNASLVGRTANVALPRLTPTFVGHLLGLGLVEIGPEDDGLKDDYQILQADTDVLAAIRASSRGPIPARVERRTLRLTDFGRQLWAAGTGEGAG